MKILLKMAWLNIWRNKRRTGILMCALIAGLSGVIFCKGFLNGWLDDMVEHAIRGLGGHIKLQASGYRRNPVVDKHLTPQPDLEQFLRGHKYVKAWTERVAVQGFISTPRHSAAVRVVGVDPASEQGLSPVPDSVTEGVYLEAGGKGQILMGRALLEKMDVRLRKKVVLMSQQLTGDIGSGAFRIVGVYDTGNEALDKHTVFVLKRDLQDMLALDGGVTEIAVMLKDSSRCDSVASELAARVAGRPIEVLTWEELMPFVTEMLDLSSKFMVPFLGVFYIAMAFGVLNTLLIAIGERTYETGVMRAVGMSRLQIVGVVMAEAACIACVATVAGAILGYGLVAWLARGGVDMSAFAEGMSYLGMSRVIRPALTGNDMVGACVAAVVMTLLSALLPAVRSARIAPVRAMRRMT